MSYACKREKNMIKLFKTSFPHKFMRVHVDYIFFNNGFNEKMSVYLLNVLSLLYLNYILKQTIISLNYTMDLQDLTFVDIHKKQNKNPKPARFIKL